MTLSNQQATQQVEQMPVEERKRLATEIADNPVFVDAMARLEQANWDAFVNSGVGDADFREFYWQSIRAVHDLRASLSATMQAVQRPTANSRRSAAEKATKSQH